MARVGVEAGGGAGGARVGVVGVAGHRPSEAEAVEALVVARVGVDAGGLIASWSWMAGRCRCRAGRQLD